jgi:hypothetical protein
MTRFSHIRFGLSLAAFVLTACVAPGCTHTINLDYQADARVLSPEEAKQETAHLERRVKELFSILTDDKVTTYNTKGKIRPYFATEEDLVDFVAIYATEFRDLHVIKERLTKFDIKDIRIEENGVVGLVRVDLVGRFYMFFPARLKEVQEWRKIHGEWYLRPIRPEDKA